MSSPKIGDLRSVSGGWVLYILCPIAPETLTIVSNRLNVVNGLKRKSQIVYFERNLTFDWLINNPSQDLFL
jgi:hypothetical protein